MTELRYYIHRQQTKRKGMAVYLYVRIKGVRHRHLLGHDLSEDDASNQAVQTIKNIGDYPLEIRI